MPKQWKLTSKRLSLKGGKFTHFIGKAWHCKVVLGFLVDYTANLEVDPLLKTVLWTLDCAKCFWCALRKPNPFCVSTPVRNRTGASCWQSLLGSVLAAPCQIKWLVHLQVIQCAPQTSPFDTHDH